MDVGDFLELKSSLQGHREGNTTTQIKGIGGILVDLSDVSEFVIVLQDGFNLLGNVVQFTNQGCKTIIR